MSKKKPSDITRIVAALAAKGYTVTSATHEPEWFEPSHPVMVRFGDREVEGTRLPCHHGGWTVTIDPPVNKGPDYSALDTIKGHNAQSLLEWIAEFPPAGEVYDDPDDCNPSTGMPASWWKEEQQ